MISTKVRQAIRASLSGSSVVFKKDGMIQLRHSYFYRVQAGGAPEAYCRRMRYALKSAVGLDSEIVSYQDNWQPWPRDSYFECILKPKGEPTL